MLSNRSIVVLIGISIIAGIVCGCTFSQRQERTTGSVIVYAIPVNNFTRLPVSIHSIQDAADTIITDNNGFKYIVQIDSLLRHAAPDYDSLFDFGSVRTAICATSFETIYLDRQSDIYFRKNVYRNSKETYSLIKKLFPRSIRGRYLREPN